MREPKYLKDYPSFSFILSRWEKAEAEIRQIRNTVFVEEQDIPADLEWDGNDQDCFHVMAYDENSNPIGTGRIHINNLVDEVSGTLVRVGHIGRIAVLKHWRGFGVGGAILVYLVHIAEAQRLESVFLNSQEHLQYFYENRKFTREGSVFHEAGIPHVRMVRQISQRPTSH